MTKGHWVKCFKIFPVMLVDEYKSKWFSTLERRIVKFKNIYFVEYKECL